MRRIRICIVPALVLTLSVACDESATGPIAFSVDDATDTAADSSDTEAADEPAADEPDADEPDVDADADLAAVDVSDDPFTPDLPVIPDLPATEDPDVDATVDADLGDDPDAVITPDADADAPDLGAGELACPALGPENVLGGSHTIDSQASLDALAGVTEIRGDLRIRDGAPLTVDLPSLAAIGDELFIESDSVRFVRTCNLSALGRLSVSDSNELLSIDATRVTEVGNVTLRDSALLETVDVRRLETITGNLRLENVPSLAGTRLDSLRIAARHAFIGPNVPQLRAPRLLDVVGDFHVVAPVGLIDFDGLQRVGGNLQLQGDGVAAHGDFRAPRLHTIQGRLRVDEVAGLTLFALNGLLAIEGAVQFTDNVDMSTFSMRSLVTIGGVATVEENASLTNFELTALANAASLQFIDNPLLCANVVDDLVARVGDGVTGRVANRGNRDCSGD